MGTNQDDEIEIDLKELFYVIKRKLWIILLTGIVVPSASDFLPQW